MAYINLMPSIFLYDIIACTTGDNNYHASIKKHSKKYVTNELKQNAIGEVGMNFRGNKIQKYTLYFSALDTCSFL